LLLALIIACTGTGADECGGNRDPNPPAFCLDVVVSPRRSVAFGTDLTFIATVKSETTADVGWSLEEAKGLTGGTLSPTHGASTVLHPQSPGHYAVRAVTLACAATLAEVDVIGTAAIDGVDVTSSATSVAPGTVVNLTAAVRGGPGSFDPSVEWSVDPTGGSLVQPTFLGDTAAFRSSAAGGVYHLTATSRGDRTKSATVTVSIQSTIAAVHVTASATTVTEVDTVTFTATVDGVGPGFDDRVVWSVSPRAFGVVLTPSGNTATFTSTLPGTYVVTATSVADSFQSDQKTVTVLKPILSIAVTATPGTAEVGQPVQLVATVIKSFPAAGGTVSWSVSPSDAANLTPTGNTTATVVGIKPNVPVTVTAASLIQPETTGSAVVTVTAPACLTQLAPLPPVEPGSHQAIDGRLPIVVDPSGLPIVGSIERSASSSFSGYVRRATASGWETLGGGPVIVTPELDGLALALDGSLRPVVAFSYFDVLFNQERVDVQRWNGSQWVDLGIPSGASRAGPEVTVTVDAIDHPVVAWKNLDGNALTAVTRWSSGTNWTPVTTVSSQEVGGFVREPDLALDPAGSSFVAWDEESVAHVHKPWAAFFDGTQLTRLGTPDPGASEFASSPSIAVDGSGLPVVAWVDYPDQPPDTVSIGIRVHRWAGTGTSWTELGGVLPAHLVSAQSPVHQLVWNQARARLGLTTAIDDTQQGALLEWDGQSWLPLCSRLVDGTGYAQGVFATGVAPEGLRGDWVAARSTSSPDLILVQRLGLLPPVTAVAPVGGGDVVPEDGTIALGCSVTNGVGPFDYAWHGYRDDGAPGPGPFVLSADAGTPVVATLVFPTSDFYFFCVATDEGLPVGDPNRTTSAYVRVHESNGPVGRFTVAPGPFHHTVDDVTANASGSTDITTPITWTLDRYVGTATPGPGIEGYLKLYTGVTTVWAQIFTTDTTSLNVTFSAATFPAPGVYRIRLDVFDAVFDSHSTYEYFTVLPP
jgi:hypothetical protein